MTIATYSDLVSAVTEWLARDNDTTLVARIPDFIMLAEAKFDRLLRHYKQETVTTITVDTGATNPERLALPTDYQTMRRIRLSSVTGKPALTFLNQRQAAEYYAAFGGNPGRPAFFSVWGSYIELIPTPDSNYTVEVNYRQSVPALTSTNTTNWLLTAAPDLYLYGTLMEAAPYMKNSDQLAIWAQAFGKCLDDLNQSGEESQHTAGPMQMRVSVATP